MRLFRVAVSIGLALSFIPAAQAESAEETPPNEPAEIGDDWMKANVEHDDRVYYGMPFASDTTRQLHIGYEGSGARGGLGPGVARAVRRNKETRYVVFFRAPKGTRVVAARAGRVADAGNGNLISVLHDDGSFARYWPIGEAKVKKGEPVERGALLGLTGAQRGGDTAQLAFGVFTVDKRRRLESLRVRFDDGSTEGFEPVQGAYYQGAEEKRAESSE